MNSHRICRLCGVQKSSGSFYKSSIWQCKDCIKKRAKERHHTKSKDALWVQKERKRSREKYKRLGYKDKQRLWDENKPWKKTSTYRNLSRDLKLKKGEEAHHWSYKNENLTSVFIMKTLDHRRAHMFLEFLDDKLCFQTNEGELLDTKEKHEAFLLSRELTPIR